MSELRVADIEEATASKSYMRHVELHCQWCIKPLGFVAFYGSENESAMVEDAIDIMTGCCFDCAAKHLTEYDKAGRP